MSIVGDSTVVKRIHDRIVDGLGWVSITENVCYRSSSSGIQYALVMQFVQKNQTTTHPQIASVDEPVARARVAGEVLR